LRSNHAQATGDTHAPRGKRRRRDDGGPAWFRPYCRAQRAINASIRLIGTTLRTVAKTERCAHRRPIHASRRLQEAGNLLVHASSQLVRAAKELVEVNACIAHEPDRTSGVPRLLAQATEHCAELTEWVEDASGNVLDLQEEVLLGLETGILVPEPPAGRRPRIILAPRPVPIRAFLRLRQARVIDRIAPLLRRRRHTPRPAAVRVPRRCLRGRAPPLVSISLS